MLSEVYVLSSLFLPFADIFSTHSYVHPHAGFFEFLEPLFPNAWCCAQRMPAIFLKCYSVFFVLIE
jgi:hypothetical protein